MYTPRIFPLLFCLTTLCACGGGSGGANNPPVVSNLTIVDSNSGPLWVGDLLAASYDYHDADGDPEGATQFQWLRGGIAISAANASSYTVTVDDTGHQLSLQVLPVAKTGEATGEAAISADMSVDYFVGTRLPEQSIESAFTGASYTFQVYLPDGYTTTASDYPLLLAVGSESGFNSIADIIDGRAQQAIIVSVYTGEDRRWTDLTMPAAPHFYDFVVLELLPYIDAQYHTDSGNRTLIGHSINGLFVGLAMLFETPGARNFSNFLSSDGSFWYESEITVQLEQQLADTVSELPITLILTAAAGETSNRYSVTGFHWLLTQSAYENFSLVYMPFELTHNEVYLPSLRAGIELLFP